MTTPVSARPGLRERKKAKTRAAIREAAMTLFEQHGYAETTVEQIAEAAEVSPSTFFRYFPTKEDVVLADDLDAPMVAALRAQPPEASAVDALLAAMRTVFTQLSPADWEAERRRQEMFRTVPELRARHLQQLTEAIDMFAEVLAERAGKPSDDLESRVIAGALVGVALAVQPQERAYGPEYLSRFEEALIILRDNLHLGTTS